MRITKFSMVGAIATVVVLSAGVATATHVFDDVEDGRFYAEAVEWAADTGITTGCGNGNFCPDNPVTRGENITFAKRYDDNVAQPRFAALDDAIEAVESRTSTNADAIDALEDANATTFISGLDFSPQTDAASWTHRRSSQPAGAWSDGGLLASFVLPDGHVIESIEFLGGDEDAGNDVLMWVARMPRVTGSYTFVTEQYQSSGGSGNFQVIAEESSMPEGIYDQPIDNTTYLYFVEAYTFGAEGDQAIFGVNVTHRPAG